MSTTEPSQPPRSPSPALPPPVAQTPGNLASRLSALYSQALTHLLRTNSFANFAACFPTPAKRKPEVLRSVWRQISDRIEERANSEFEDICRERDVVRGLNELERLVAEARGRKERGEGEVPVAPHTLDPQSLYLAHLSPYLQQVQQELNAKLRETEAQNQYLLQELEKQKEEVERLVGGLETVVRDLGEANGVLEGAVLDGNMKGEIMEMDGELKGVGRETETVS